MGHYGIHVCVFLLGIFASAYGSHIYSCKPHYLVTVPAVLQSGTQAQFCLVVLKPYGFVKVFVKLVSEDGTIVLLKKKFTSHKIRCYEFTVPVVKKPQIRLFKVKVKGPYIYDHEEKKVLIYPAHPLAFIQTDQAIYAPGDTVNFQAVTVNGDLGPVETEFDFIIVKDPQNNIIFQLENIETTQSIYENSFALGPGAQPGYYRMVLKLAHHPKHRIFASFLVVVGAMPTFDVKISAPDEISIGQKIFKVKVCARNKYGKPVEGSVEVMVCRPLKSSLVCASALTYEDLKGLRKGTPCKTKTKRACSAGCTVFKFKVSSFTNIDPKGVLDVLDIKATVQDKSTCVAYTKWDRITISQQLGTLFFHYTPETYISGNQLCGKIKAVSYYGEPVPNLRVYLYRAGSLFPQSILELTTNQDGIAEFCLGTYYFHGNLVLKASTTEPGSIESHPGPFYETAMITVTEQAAGYPNINYLNVEHIDRDLHCGKVEEITIQYSFMYSPHPYKVVCLILSRGRIIKRIKRTIQPNYYVNQGEFTIHVKIKPELAPHFKVLAFVAVYCKKLLADSALFHTTDCFENHVRIHYIPDEAAPGQEIKLKLKGDPYSLCGVRTIDVRTLKKNPGTLLTPDTIYGSLPFKKGLPVPSQLLDFGDCLRVRPKRNAGSFPPFPSNTYPLTNMDGSFAYEHFVDCGLQILTNLIAPNPSCLKLKGKKYFQDLEIDSIFNLESEEAPDVPEPGTIAYTCPEVDPIEPVHTLTTERWVFGVYKIDQSGMNVIQATVPDIDTHWKAEAFCVNQHGFGVAHPKVLHVIRPFALHLLLPPCVFLGESFLLKAIVVNNLEKCIKIKVSTNQCSDFSITEQSIGQSGVCLCGVKHKTFTWIVTPNIVGTVNVKVTAEAIGEGTTCDEHPVFVPVGGQTQEQTVSVVVKSAGAEISKSSSWLLCPKGHILKQRAHIDIPHDVVHGTVQMSVAASGDVFANTVQQLNCLSDMPHANGDWNIAQMAIYIEILCYLQNTQQITPALQEKIVSALSNGYQTMLGFRLSSGAYSIFKFGPPSSWLTAYVLMTFFKAQPFIYIDKNLLKESRKWLECQQQPNGCFKVTGEDFTRRRKSCMIDELAHTAFITTAFLEIGVSTDNTCVNKSLTCLKESLKQPTSLLGAAASLWAFTLAGDIHARAHLLSHLDKVEVKEGFFFHPRPKTTPTCSMVLIRAYVLLAKASITKDPDQLLQASHSYRWLVEHSGHLDNFGCIQSTVVAVKAMALYSTVTHSPICSAGVTVHSLQNHVEFHLSSENRLQHQERELSNPKENFLVTVEGSACAFVEIRLQYNTYKPAVQYPLTVEAGLKLQSCYNEKLKFTLTMVAEYKGDHLCTNMLVLEIQIPSGFVPIPQSLKSLRESLAAEHVEYKKNYVRVHIQKLYKNVAVTYSLHIAQEYIVTNNKATTVVLYDYQNPEIRDVAYYCVEAAAKQVQPCLPSTAGHH